MEYLVKNLWGLIEHKNSLNSLESSQMKKEEFLERIIKGKKDSVAKRIQSFASNLNRDVALLDTKEESKDIPLIIL